MATINGVNVSSTALLLDIDPNQNATFTETIGAPEPATWTLLLAVIPLLLRSHRKPRRPVSLPDDPTPIPSRHA